MWITDVRKNNYSTVAAINYSTAAATTSATSPPSGRSRTTNGVTGMPFWRPSRMHIPRGDGADVVAPKGLGQLEFEVGQNYKGKSISKAQREYLGVASVAVPNPNMEGERVAGQGDSFH